MPDSTTNGKRCNAVGSSAVEGGSGARLRALDLIRGVAILGILPVHISLFSGPGINPQQGVEGWQDHLFSIPVMLVFEGKMVTLLSILFGVGLALQADHAQAAGRQFAPYYRRRMLVLFLIGLGHALFLFQFDILTSYAVAGLIALLFVRLPHQSLLRVAAGCLAWCYGSILLFTLILIIFTGPEIEATGPRQPTGATAEQPSEGSTAASVPAEIGSAVEKFFSEQNETRIFRHGSFAEMVLHRAVYVAIVAVLFWLEVGWYILACVLIGIWLNRRGVFHQVDSHRLLFRKWTGFGLALGVSFHVAGIVAYVRDPEGLLPLCLLVFGVLPLAFVYLSLLTLWAQSGRAQWLQSLLRAVGRLALSNYLMQSLVCGFVFYGYGFDYYGRLGRAATFGVVLALWTLQMLVSRLWLRRFQIGPAEWLWRSLTEGRWYAPPQAA